MYNKMNYLSSFLCFYVNVLQFLNLLCEWNSLNECNVQKELVSFHTQISIYYLDERLSVTSHCLKRYVRLSSSLQVFNPKSINNIRAWQHTRYEVNALYLEGGIMTAQHCLKRCVELTPFSKALYTLSCEVHDLNSISHTFNTYIVQCRQPKMIHPCPQLLKNFLSISLLNTNE